jgi:two-component system cell cycle sensor histidine kinase/response regulator CckA
LADKSQLETVLMNLCVNARDAMAEQGGGEITIETRALKIEAIDDMNLKQSLAGLASDNLAVISVSDTGSGIPPHILEKIFEPFFTTKEQGKGTGLGLATVYGIVQQSGGHLTVESTLGVGTSFHLYFPQVSEEDARAAAEAAVLMPKFNETRAPADLAGQGHILFVEDEDDVRLMAARTLRKRGYNVVEAGDGEEALEILEDDEISFDLMISDVVMPGMDGPTLLKRGKEALGDARIIFISGYAQEDFSELLAEHPDVSFLPKPFGLKELAEKVKEQIGESVV